MTLGPLAPRILESYFINSLIIMMTLFYKIPPHLPCLRRSGFAQAGFSKGREITLHWPPAHRASLRGMSPSGAEPDPEGKEGPGEILQCMSILMKS